MREKTMNEFRFDLHVHSLYSRDCKSHPKDIIKMAKKMKMAGIAITDHNTVDFHLSKIDGEGLLIIPGVEISTKSGHIIGLGLKETIPKRLSIEETTERIIELGGYPIVSHPFDFTRKEIGKKIRRLKGIAVEALNGSSPVSLFNNKAEAYAKANNLPITGGSDSHRVKDIGMAYTISEQEISSVDDLIEEIRKRKTKVGGSHLTIPEKIIRTFQIHF